MGRGREDVPQTPDELLRFQRGQIPHNISSLCLIYHIMDEKLYEKLTRSLREATRSHQQPTSSDPREVDFT